MHRGDVWLINLDPTVGAEIKKGLRGPNEVRWYYLVEGHCR